MSAWTYSRLEKFETCPKQFYHQHVAKDFQSQETIHTKWGKEVHTAMELRVRDGVPLPEGMQQWERVAAKVAALPGDIQCERKLALTDSFQEADWDSAWCRGIGDVVVIHRNRAAVVDWKTGKRKPSEQLELYGAVVLNCHPEVEVVSTGYVWLKSSKVDRGQVARKDLGRVWSTSLNRVKRLTNAYENNRWPANPSGLCRGWCPVITCPHYKSRG